MFIQWGKQVVVRGLVFFGVLVLGSVFFASHTQAATLFVSPGGGERQFGTPFDVEIRVDSAGKSFNAAEATIQYAPDMLEVKSLSYSGGASAFSFWLEEPTFSNKTGTIHFIGGSTVGVNGPSIPVLRITFNSKGNGNATVGITGAAITASDGSGTNILSGVRPAKFTITAATLAPLPSEPAAPSAIPVLAPPAPIITPTSTPVVTSTIPIVLGPPPAPIQIVRKAEIAKEVSDAPNIKVQVYPKEDAWYNVRTNYLVTWNLPPDVIQVATAVNTNKTFDPKVSEGLFDAKMFPALDDGIWYLHVRFKNNIGWSTTTHYRIAMDTVSPSELIIESSTGLQSDFPQPILSLNTKDGLSGVVQYSIQVDSGEVMTQATSTIMLPLLAPGKHTVLVKAFDAAGNSTQNTIELDILPIEAPKISSVPKNLFLGEGGLSVSGSALANVDILLDVKNASGISVAEKTVHSDAVGNWNMLFDVSFKKGTYIVEATAKDRRGALSLPVYSSKIIVKEKPILTIGNIEVTLAWVYVFSIVVFIILTIWGVRSFFAWRERTAKRVIIAQRDVANVFSAVGKDIDKVLQNSNDKKLDPTKIAEMQFILKKMKKNLERVEDYVEENIKDISK